MFQRTKIWRRLLSLLIAVTLAISPVAVSAADAPSGVDELVVMSADETDTGNEPVVPEPPEGNEPVVPEPPEGNEPVVPEPPEGNEPVVPEPPEGNEPIVPEPPEGNEPIVPEPPEGNEPDEGEEPEEEELDEEELEKEEEEEEEEEEDEKEEIEELLNPFSLFFEPAGIAVPFNAGWATTGVQRYATVEAFITANAANFSPGYWGTAPTALITTPFPQVEDTSAVAIGAGNAGPGSILTIDPSLTTRNLPSPIFFKNSVQGQGRATVADNPNNQGAMAYMAFNGLRTQGAIANSGTGWNVNNASGTVFNFNAGNPAASRPAINPVANNGLLVSSTTVNVGIAADLLQSASTSLEWPLVDTVLMQASYVTPAGANGNNPFNNSGQPDNGVRIGRITIESGTTAAYTELPSANAHIWNWPATVNNSTGLSTLNTTSTAEWRTFANVVDLGQGLNNTDRVFLFHLEEPVRMRYLRANIELLFPAGHQSSSANAFPGNISINFIEAYNTQAVAPDDVPELVDADTTMRHMANSADPVRAAYELNGFTLQQLRVGGNALAAADYTTALSGDILTVTFDQAFINGLSAGRRTVEAVFRNSANVEETVSHNLSIVAFTGIGWNTVTGSQTGVRQYPNLAAFLTDPNKPALPNGYWGIAPAIPGVQSATRSGPENMLVINFTGTQNGDGAIPDAHFRRSVTGQQFNPQNTPPGPGSHAFMAFNGLRIMGPFNNSGVGWNTSGASAQNLARPDGSNLSLPYHENVGIAADLLQGAMAGTPWPFVDTIVLHASTSNNGFPLIAPGTSASGIGRISLESGTTAAFTALNSGNGHSRTWPTSVDDATGLADLEDQLQTVAQWRTVGGTVTIQPGNENTVFVFHLDQPVPMRYLRAGIEIIMPANNPGGAGNLPGSIGINFFEVYNTQAYASRPWFLPAESTVNYFSGSPDPVNFFYRENGFNFSTLSVGGQALTPADYTVTPNANGITVTLSQGFLDNLAIDAYTVEAGFSGYAESLTHVLNVLSADGDTPPFTVTAAPITIQPAPAPRRDAEIVSPNPDGTLTYNPWTTHNSLARGLADETGHELEGNTMPDFSGVGFRGGREDIPFLNSSNSFVHRLTANPSGDDTARINEAIALVGTHPMRANGFRGVVELGPGTFRISGQEAIKLNRSGVVLRGSGQGPDGTILLFTHRPGSTVLPNAHIFRHLGVAITMGTTAFEGLAPEDGSSPDGVIAGSGGDSSITYSNSTAVAEGWYPIGSNRLTLASTSGFRVGDRISLLRTPSRNWVNIMNLTSAGNWGFPHDNPALNVGEGALNYRLDFERVITAIDGNDIIIDIPLVTALNIPTDDTAQVRLINESNRILNIGVENLRIVSARDQDDLMSINRGRTAIRTISVRDGFIRDTTSVFFPFGHTNLYHNSTNISVLNNSYLSPAVELTISARLYAFTIDHGTNSLFDGNYVQGGRYEFVTGAAVAGPNVFLDGTAEASRLGPENHHRWSVGTLFDSIRMLEGNDTFLHAGTGINPPVSGRIGHLRVENRGNNGTGQGWVANTTVFWNPTTNDIIHNRPPTGQNFVVGLGGLYPGVNVRLQDAIGGPGASPAMTALVQALHARYGSTYVENVGFRVEPGSLYRAQVALRATGDYRNAVPGRPLLQRPMPDTWVDTTFAISGVHDQEAESVSVYINGVFHGHATMGNAGNNNEFVYNVTLTPGYHSIATAQTVNGTSSHLTAIRFVNVRENGVFNNTPSGFTFNQISAATQNMMGRITTLPPDTERPPVEQPPVVHYPTDQPPAIAGGTPRSGGGDRRANVIVRTRTVPIRATGGGGGVASPVVEAGTQQGPSIGSFINESGEATSSYNVPIAPEVDIYLAVYDLEDGEYRISIEGLPDGIIITDIVEVIDGVLVFQLLGITDLMEGIFDLTITLLDMDGNALADDVVLTLTIGDAEAQEQQQAPVQQAPVQPTQESTVLRFEIGNPQYSADGMLRNAADNAAPFIDPDTGRTVMPLRVVAESLGADVTWIEETRTVIIFSDGITLTIPVDTPLPRDMGSPLIVEGRTFVPIRYVAEMLGATVTWDGDTQSVYIER